MDEITDSFGQEHRNALDLFEELRVLAAADPKEARVRFCHAIDSSSPELGMLIQLISAPGEGRLRQLVANAIRSRPDRGGLIHYLQAWHDSEADEFAKRAIAAALKGVPQPRSRGAIMPTRAAESHQDLVDLADTYRYVADRLCHLVRNALPEPDRRQRRIQALARTSENEEIVAEAVALGEAFRRLSRVVEFDVDDEYFCIKPFSILDWIEAMNLDFAAQFEPILLTIIRSPDWPGAQVLANSFWLETAFRNIWRNAANEVGVGCRITVEATIQHHQLVLLILDNGPGFPENAEGVVFQEQFSPRGGNHGRGLLEVLDSVRRMKGNVKLVRRAGVLRLEIVLPLARID